MYKLKPRRILDRKQLNRKNQGYLWLDQSIGPGLNTKELWQVVKVYIIRNRIGRILKVRGYPVKGWILGNRWKRIQKNMYYWGFNAKLMDLFDELRRYKLRRLICEQRKSFLYWDRSNQIKKYFKITLKNKIPFFKKRKFWSVRFLFNRSTWFRLKLYTKLEKLKNSIGSFFFKSQYIKWFYRGTKWVEFRKKIAGRFFRYHGRRRIYPQLQKRLKWLKRLRHRVMWRFRRGQNIKKRKYLIWLLRKYYYKKFYLHEKFFKKFKNFPAYTNFSENRLVQVVLATGVIKNYKAAVSYIKFGKVFVNNACIRDINYETSPNDIIFLNIEKRYWRYRKTTNFEPVFTFRHNKFLSYKRSRIFYILDKNKHKKNIKKFRLVNYYNYRLLSKCD